LPRLRCRSDIRCQSPEASRLHLDRRSAVDQGPCRRSRTMNRRQPFRALAHRNFRLFFLGQSVSMIGTWVQQLAMSWLVYELTGKSPFWLGFIGFLGQIPTLFLAPFVGVWVDRWNRHRLIVITQTLAMLQAFALAALTYIGSGPDTPYGLAQVRHVVALSLFLGVVNIFDMTARQAFLTEM